MKINYAQVQDIYQPQPNPVQKGPNKFFCLECKKTLDIKQFFKTTRLDKFPAGVVPVCKTCATILVDDTDPTTFLSILKEINIPYIPVEWRALLVKKDPRAPSILGKYASKMRLNQFSKYTWADTERLVEEHNNDLLAALRQKTDTETEAEAEVEKIISMDDLRPAEPKTPALQPSGINFAALYGLSEETSKYHLTQDEINQLKLDWGPDYSEEQYLSLEQMFADMKDAYVIQDPIAISNARMICKMTVKMNKYLDIDDVVSASSISKQLDLYIKSANLAPVQQKDRQQTTFAISQLAFLCEHEGGFIPEFYIAEPNDKIDMVLQDMQEFTRNLILAESNISEMVENTEAILAQERLPEAVQSMDDFEALEAELLGEIEEIDNQEGE